MIVFAAFMDVDADLICPQDMQASGFEALGGAHGVRALAARGPAWSVWQSDPPTLLFVGGLALSHANYATCWSVISNEAGPSLTAITRRARHEVAELGMDRTDMLVSVNHEAGVRWAGLLGFELEARLGGAMADGSDALIFVKRRGEQDG